MESLDSDGQLGPVAAWPVAGGRLPGGRRPPGPLGLAVPPGGRVRGPVARVPGRCTRCPPWV